MMNKPSNFLEWDYCPLFLFERRPADGATHYRVGSVAACDTLSMVMLAQQKIVAIVT
ncbi:hypothetical protein GCM10022296_09610 [Secundilactobacillus similis DSM 23365 = JCM 2765]